MKQAYNPYLPLYEYVPDGEPHVFGDRLYIYGSHDIAGGEVYCADHYVTWSAPLDDLTDWRYEGEIYQRTQDPDNTNDTYQLWAPDVAQGPDGRYYLYYCLNFVPKISVAVSDSPAGPFTFYGHVKYGENLMNGKILEEHLPFDPAIFVDDDQRIFLYYGFSPARPMAQDADIEALGLSEEEAQAMREKMSKIGMSEGGMVVELQPDMKTMIGAPKVCIPGGMIEEGTGFEGHGFYEASSMRKINGRYYYVYSSKLSHELCYAVSDYPDHGFRYGGTLISNGNIGYQGNTIPQNMMGNNHGGLVEVKGRHYIFYHRQTHATESSRQGCAEAVKLLPDGSICQVEMTSCGLNGGPLAGQGSYPAPIACYLTSRHNVEKITYGQSLKNLLPYIYEDAIGSRRQDHTCYIAHLTDGDVAGYKYFRFQDLAQITVTVRGNANGRLLVFADTPLGNPAAVLDLSLTEGHTWQQVSSAIQIADGIHALYFRYEGDGTLDFKEFSLK